MSQLSQAFVVTAALQTCGAASGPGAGDVGSFFSCHDYQIMLEVEVEVGGECRRHSDCTQVLISGDLACEPNSILVHDDYDTNYFSDLYDDALAEGCDITLDMNEDCRAVEAECVASRCTWRR